MTDSSSFLLSQGPHWAHRNQRHRNHQRELNQAPRSRVPVTCSVHLHCRIHRHYREYTAPCIPQCPVTTLRVSRGCSQRVTDPFRQRRRIIRGYQARVTQVYRVNHIRDTQACQVHREFRRIVTRTPRRHPVVYHPTESRRLRDHIFHHLNSGK